MPLIIHLNDREEVSDKFHLLLLVQADACARKLPLLCVDLHRVIIGLVILLRQEAQSAEPASLIRHVSLAARRAHNYFPAVLPVTAMLVVALHLDVAIDVEVSVAPRS